MNKYIKKIIATMLLMVSMIIISGCTSKDNMNEFLKEYKSAWEESDFDKLYNMLAKESRDEIGKEEFIETYEQVYRDIEAENIKVSIVDSEVKVDEVFNINVSMNTLGGKIESDEVKLKIIDEDGYKVVWNESLILPQLEKGDKVKCDTSEYKAKRGNIYDRNDELIAGDGVLRPVQLNLNKFNNEDIVKTANILDVSEEFIENKIKNHTNLEHALHLVDLLDDDKDKMNELIKIDGVQIPKAKGMSRVYYGGESIGSLIGYVGNITAEQLEKLEGKGYSNTSEIGIGGIEEVYESKLRGIDGGKVYIQKPDGSRFVVAEKKEKNGKDLKLSIDIKLQQKVYDEMQREKGASVALDPKTGEVLAMVSSPSFDPNTYVTYLTKTEKQKWEESNNAQKERRFKYTYSPGSTMKLVTAAIGLDNNKIDPDKAIKIEGKVWEEYKVTRVNDKVEDVTLRDAVKYSDNIYFAKVGLEIGDKLYTEEARKFGVGEDLEFAYPLGKSKISNSGNLSEKALLADTAYGQGEVLITPLEVAMIYSSLGNEGKIMQPIIDISEGVNKGVYKEAIKIENLPTLIECFKSVINDSDGTGNKAKINGIDIAGKTGTAEIKTSKDDTNGTENGWFVAVDVESSRLAVSMIIEDVKGRGGSDLVTPKVKNIMEYYLN